MRNITASHKFIRDDNNPQMYFVLVELYKLEYFASQSIAQSHKKTRVFVNMSKMLSSHNKGTKMPKP